MKLTAYKQRLNNLNKICKLIEKGKYYALPEYSIHSCSCCPYFLSHGPFNICKITNYTVFKEYNTVSDMFQECPMAGLVEDNHVWLILSKPLPIIANIRS